MFLFLLLKLSLQGTIWPYDQPIKNTIANRQQFADYNFTMKPDTSIPQFGQVDIIFPSQYLAGLGIDLVDTNTCSEICSINGFTVTFTLENAVDAGTPLNLIIKQVYNPLEKGGTGNFIVRTKLGQNVFDENLIFGTIGIADYALDFDSLLIYIDPNSTNVAGQSALYNFVIKPPQDLVNFYLQINVPFVSDLTTCQFITYNFTKPNYNINCTGQIIITGFQTIPAQTSFAIQINFINPQISTTTQPFTVIAYRMNTTMIYSWRNQYPGVYIQPGTLINSTLTPALTTCQSVTEYTLTFITLNQIPSRGSVLIQMPANYFISYLTGYDLIQVISGLYSSSIVYNYSLTQLQISNFELVPNGTQITILIRGQNPSFPGLSSSFKIFTMNGGYIIDQITTGLTMTTTQAISMLPQIGTLTQLSALTSTNLQFQFVPNKLTAAYIQINFVGWVVSAPLITSCVVQGVAATSCTASGTTLKITSPYLTSTTTIQIIDTILKTPSQATQIFHTQFFHAQLIYFQTFDLSNTLLENGAISAPNLPTRNLAYTLSCSSQVQSTAAYPIYSACQITFTPAQQIPAYYSPPNSTNPPKLGVLWVEFGPLSTFDTSLGGSPFCQSNLVAITNLTLSCQFVAGSNTINPKIYFINFDTVAAGTQIKIQLSNILNPQSTSPVISVFSGYRQFTDLVLQDYGQATLTLQANPSLAWTTDITGNFFFSSQNVNTTFNINFNQAVTSAITTTGIVRIILPSYGEGFVQNASLITCSINNVLKPCVAYQGADWIDFTFTAAGTVVGTSLQINNLQWPSTSAQVGYMKIIVINGQQEIQKLIQTQSNLQFPAPIVNGFQQATVLQYQPGRGYAGQTFTFQFQVANIIPSGSTMAITFPVDFYPALSNPTPLCNGYDISSIGVQHDAGAQFTVICSGVKTPLQITNTISTGWSVSIYYQGRLMNQQLNFFQYAYADIFSEGTIKILQLFANPPNQGETSVYTITFQLQNQLLTQSQIYITFPSNNFNELPYPPILADCQLQGALNSFQSCLLVGSVYQIITNAAYSSGIITFQINHVVNPNLSISDGFIIQTYYDSVLIDQTDQSTLLNRTVTYYNKASNVLINSFTFSPQNMGLSANYYFNFTLPINLTKDYQLVITFPDLYDNRLGDNLMSQINNQSVTFTVTKRLIYYQKGDFGQQIYVRVQNVVNPNTFENSNTGQFRIGVIYNGQYIAYNSTIGVLEMMDPPGWLFLSNVTLSNQYSRWQSQYTLFMTLYNDLPEYLQVDFPSQYDISDANATCSFSSCAFSENILKAYASPQNGNLQFQVIVENPVYQVTINNMVVKSQNSIKIVEQSYSNLDPYQFKFTYSGPLITINGDNDIIVYQGTESPDLYFLVIYPQALNLTFQYTQTGSLVVYPKDILFNYQQMSATFRIRTPLTQATGMYYIYWNTIGEQSPPIYTPVKKSRILVQSQTVPIMVSQLYPIPFGGNSLPVTVSIERAPYDTLTITVSSNDLTFYLVSGTQVGQSITLQYQVGINSQQFTVYQNYTIYNEQNVLGTLSEEQRLISFKISNPLYQSVKPLVVTYISDSGLSPQIGSVAVANITQTNVQLTVSTSQIVQVYYMLCLNYTITPTIAELLSLGPPLHETTQSQYGSQIINLNGTVSLTIKSQIDYSFYIVAINREGMYSTMFSMNFSSLARYRICQFTVTTSVLVNQAQVLNILKNIAFVLSLPTSKVVQKTAYSVTTTDNTTNTTTTTNPNTGPTNQIVTQIIPFNNTLNYPSPQQLVSILSSSQLTKRYLPQVSSIGGAVESQSIIPNITASSIINSTYYDCWISATLDIQGWIYGIASGQNVSTSYQIFSGLDYQNIKVPSTYYRVLTLEAQQFRIQNLQPNSTYKIYLIPASDLPEYPDLSPNVSTLSCTTQKLPSRIPYTIKYGIILQIMILII